MQFTLSVAIVLAFATLSSGQVTNEKKLLTNCFGDNENGTCEESWIKIFTSFYTCSMVVDLPEPAKRIGHINGQLVVNIKSNFYVLTDGILLVPYNGRGRVAPWSEFRDRRDNSFYAADGTAYMYRDEDQRELEIVTTGEYGSHQLALDSEEDKLLILAFDATSEGTAELFSLKTDSSDIVDDKINAVKVEGAGDSLTAMEVEGGLDKLILSVKTPNGGKLIRLVKQNSNPCSVVGMGKDAIVDIVKEAQQKLVKIFEESHNFAEIGMKNNIRTLGSPLGMSPRALELDNERLKRELTVANKKLTALNTRLFVFSKRVSPSITSSTASPPIATGYQEGFLVKYPSELNILEDKVVLNAANFSKPQLSLDGNRLQCVSANKFSLVERELSESKRLNEEYGNRLSRLNSAVSRLLSGVFKNEDEN